MTCILIFMNILLSGAEDGSFPFVIMPSRPGDSTFILVFIVSFIAESTFLFVLVPSAGSFAYFTFAERYSLREGRLI